MLGRLVIVATIAAAAFANGVCGGLSTGGEELWTLPRLSDDQVLAENGLWIETPLERRFHHAKRVVVAEAEGPGIITMIHFALPQRQITPDSNYRLGRDLVIRMYWDGETHPSVECPLVDFFCDPAGERERLDTTMVNKKRGWNAYFPMPFRKSAKIELVYDGELAPGEELWAAMPCYSYVMIRKTASLPEDVGYFHAYWRQELLNLAERDYVALAAEGRGKFVGWNVTLRLPGRPGYPVDMNEKFFIDGESQPAVEFQGIEDSFGFSWGFPPEENLFPRTGFFPFHQDGAAAYRFFLSDAITFRKSLKVTIGFGANEHPMFREMFGRPGNELELASTCYWYQSEPHVPFSPMRAAKDRAPLTRDWRDMEQLPTDDERRERGVKLEMRCGRPEEELVFAEPGYHAETVRGFAYTGWPFPMFHTRADEEAVHIVLHVPPQSAGLLRLYMIDPDHFQGGRRQEVFVGERSLGIIADFDRGRWLEAEVDGNATAEGTLPIRIVNRSSNANSNAVLSIIEWVERP
ncbi:MAG: glycoside hydrolase family 172 protein [Thermogutta sp.]